ncbi:MAG TPA: glycoside hydrolase family 3 C-terminal domain-containing protein [Acidisarcina sp.]|nr:glycoside hydrolase family 3 C-terminal domain-containing protein [Acidisarcina sp.]
MRIAPIALLVLAGFASGCLHGMAQTKAATAPLKQQLPWMNPVLDPDTRADLVIHEMTLDEKIQLVHGEGGVGYLLSGATLPKGHNLGAGYVPGIPRLRLPDINLADSAVGVRMGALQSRYATLLPSVLGMAASWDTTAAYLYGSVIGRELRDQGFNMSIGGGVNLIREPRNGRNFEYASEDPILSGVMVGELARGLQSNHVMGDLKHYVLNDQETGRESLNAVLNPRALRETDLLAFQIAIGIGQPAGIMCSYNRVNGDYACENDSNLNHVLKHDFGFKGWVLSDWGGTHSTVKAALAGLDQEQAGGWYFGAPLKEAVLKGQVPQSRLDDMVHRIVRSMFANGIVDDPPVRRVVDPFRGRDEAQKIEEESIVLLRNEGSILPLSRERIRSIAVIGGHADVGVLSGGGSAQVDPPGGNAIDPAHSTPLWTDTPVYFPSSPLRCVRELAQPETTITYDSGADLAKSARIAAAAQVALVFVDQWMAEGHDAETLSLPNRQDDLVTAVAAANPNTIVVLETGGPVKMPWALQVKGILEAWYPGIGGGQAIANVLFGRTNPSGRLPVTFPATEADLPYPQVTGLAGLKKNQGVDGKKASIVPEGFTLDYNGEGLTPGYRWFQVKNKQPLFPFGFGLSYTRFLYSGLQVDPAAKSVSFDLRNGGDRQGDEVAQVYVTLPAKSGEPFRRLAGWRRVSLAPGESQRVDIPLNPLYLSIFSVEDNAWHRLAGEYVVEVGTSSANLPLHASLVLSQAAPDDLKP